MAHTHPTSNPMGEDGEPMQVVFAEKMIKHPVTLFEKVNARLPLLALGILALLAAMWGGLVRVGWQFPPIIQFLPAMHGPLMITGFLGTLISMERAVALRQRWTYGVPILNIVGALVLLFNVERHIGILIATLGSIGLLMIFVVILNRQLALYTSTMALGVVVWVIGNLLWLGDTPVYRITMWWAGFLILTIIGERLELSRIQRLPRAAIVAYSIAIGIFLVGLCIDIGEGLIVAGTDVGARLIGLGLLAIALWLARYDIARRTVRQQGITRFIALSLLLGYFWLGIGGGLKIIYGGVAGGMLYDAVLHTIFLGFVMSMIFGHAPIILPAILGRAITYRPMFYVHLVLLHASLVLRVIGDLTFTMPLRQWGAMFNVIAILFFLFAILSTILRSVRTN